MDSTSEIDNELAEGALFEQVQVAATSPITINAGSNPPKSSAEREAELRRSLLDIQNDTSLDPREKAKRMQVGHYYYLCVSSDHLGSFKW